MRRSSSLSRLLKKIEKRAPRLICFIILVSLQATQVSAQNSALQQQFPLGKNISSSKSALKNNELLHFSGNDSAGSASIINSNKIVFLDNSTADKTKIRNDQELLFQDSSSLGSATLLNNFELVLRGNAQAENASITNEGKLFFFENSTASHASIRNNNALHVAEQASLGNAKVHNHEVCFLYDNSTAADARILNHQQLQIFGNSTAGRAKITNNFGFYINGNGDAGNATILNNGYLFFFENAHAEGASISGAHGSFIDISGMDGEGIAIGSLQGTGELYLGDKQLTLGGLHRDNTLSGKICDGIGPQINGLAAGEKREKRLVGGQLSKVGNGTLTLTAFNNYTGSTHVLEGALCAGNDSTFSPHSDFHIHHHAVLNLNGHHQTIKELTNNGCIRFGPNQNYVTLVIKEDLKASNGLFCMHVDLENGLGDHLRIQGHSAGNHVVRVIQRPESFSSPTPSLELISTTDGAASFHLEQQTLDAGAFAYTLKQGTGSQACPSRTNWYLVNSGLNGLTHTAINSTRLIPLVWFQEFETLIDRLGELRLQTLPEECPLTEGAVWGRGFGQKVNFFKNHRLESFASTQYGLQVGIDKMWAFDGENAIYAGAFGGYTHGDVNGKRRHASGIVQTGFGGLYFTWINLPGWYLDAVVKADHFTGHFKDSHAQAAKSHGHYNTWGTGFSLEGGYRFDFDEGYYLEPQGQISYLHLSGTNFHAHDYEASFHDSDVIELRAGVLAAYQTESCEYGKLELYVKGSLVEQTGCNGHLNGGGLRYKPTFSGIRFDFSSGIAAQLNEKLQCDFSYEASTGETYTKPWGFNLNLRYIF